MPLSAGFVKRGVGGNVCFKKPGKEEDDETKYLSVGFDKMGNLLEIMYNYIDEKTIKVFHAMKCRKQFYIKLEKEGLWQI